MLQYTGQAVDERRTREPLAPSTGFALMFGLVLFLGSGAAAWGRAGEQVLLPRLAVLAALVVALVLPRTRSRRSCL